MNGLRDRKGQAAMENFLLYWGPTLLVGAIVVVVMRLILSRQAKFFKTQADNVAAQTAELSKIHQSLERVASALEGDNGNKNSN